ncbi:Clavaminate synthase-like protein [Fistulina hepatica ATCC 64428]|nr:Clavaminate synthase-like protein [Fistulina hepatica ATCC 64428]
MAKRRRNNESTEIVNSTESQDVALSADDEKCPACDDDPTSEPKVKESWVKCDNRKCENQWYHWECAGDESDSLDAIDKWFCPPCRQADPSRRITYKVPARKSSRKHAVLDYANLNGGFIPSDASKWIKKLQGKVIHAERFQRMSGRDVGIEWLESEPETAMLEPMVIEEPDGLGMEMPPADLSVDDITQLVGESTPVEVMDVSSQSNSAGWTMGKWAHYFNLSEHQRDKIRNVISLEISDTKLGATIKPPRLVRELDWVENFWPNTRKGKGHVFPKVQLYCLMGVSNAWTDWHIDFAGSSVYYHILSGSKVFYFIRPTPSNLEAYEKWSGSELQSQTWLGDMVDEVVKITLTEGNTMFIPSGWIHAVFTPIDTIVFGGNFLHSYSARMQLRIRDIEIVTRVPKKFQYPMFVRLCWYVADKYLRDLRSSIYPSPRVLDSLEALADLLVSQVRVLEKAGRNEQDERVDKAAKEVKEAIPSDRIKDPAGLARELRWRVKFARGESSDDEAGQGRMASTPLRADTFSRKRRRTDHDIGPSTGQSVSSVQFRNFKPKVWDEIAQQENSTHFTTRPCGKPMPGEDDWIAAWMKWDGDEERMSVEDDKGTLGLASVQVRRHVATKVRRTAEGLERQRVDRIHEQWTHMPVT